MTRRGRALERFDFAKRAVTELASEADWFEASGDGSRLVISDQWQADRRPGRPEDRSRTTNDDKIVIDRGRARFSADPPALWAAGLWRGVPDHAARLTGSPTWPMSTGTRVREEYRPLLDRIASQDDFTDLLWEVFGELGTSHAYATRSPAVIRSNAGNVPGVLGADLERDGDTWRVSQDRSRAMRPTRARGPRWRRRARASPPEMRSWRWTASRSIRRGLGRCCSGRRASRLR